MNGMNCEVIAMRVVLFLIPLLLTTPSFAEEWLCIAEKSIGYEYDTASKQWIGKEFETENKYLIAAASSSSYPYWIAVIGSKNTLAVCEEDFGTIGVEKDILTCSDWMVHFQFNRSNGRFMYTYLIGYLQGKDDGTTKPSVEIGKCSAI